MTTEYINEGVHVGMRARLTEGAVPSRSPPSDHSGGAPASQSLDASALRDCPQFGIRPQQDLRVTGNTFPQSVTIFLNF